jgi:uncharacterized membrane protein YphA (DoxX/SURF4 family)
MTKENSCSQIRIITRITAIACLASMLLCHNLWLEDRNFPTVPVLHLFTLKHPYDFVLPIIAGILLIFIALLRNPQKLLVVFIIAASLLWILDTNRWQPWFYQYCLMFFILAFFNYRCDDTRQQQVIVTTFKLMIAAVYFWSGLQKLNPNFPADTFPWLMEPITKHLSEGSINNFRFLGYAFPLLEICTGICLLIPALRRPAVVLSLLMHVFILFVLSPLGHNYNPVVWPWNIAMMIFVFILFYNDHPFGINDIRNIFSYRSAVLVTVLFVMMPLFNFFNSWDSYLSHNLYSGNTSNGIIIISEEVKQKLPRHIQNYVFADGEQFQINIKYWCMKELGVPAYPEKRNFEAVTGNIHNFSNDSSQVFLMFSPKIKLIKN